MKLSSAPPLLPAFDSSVESVSTLPPVVETKQDDLTVDLPDAIPLENFPNATTREQPAKQLKQGAVAVFGSTFLTIFLSEMGDKTQVATLLMSAESQSPWVVFAGASTALVATSLLGCLLGRWLANRVSPKMLKTAAGISLLFIATQLLWEILHS
ncbi:MAG TPA: TMEM165/GDT1 family protein [Leptolyngbyaceae cyanobacterium]